MRRIFLSLALSGVLCGPISAAPLRVVTSIPDLAVIAKAIGGDAVETATIVRGNRDVHTVELFPSLMLRVRQATVYVKVGMDLDLWAQQIIDGSRNATLVVVDASERVEKLEVPTFKVDASYGDLHAFGNPHYWLDPANARPIGEAILAGLARVAPERTPEFRRNLDAYLARIDDATTRWQARLAPYRGAQLVSFHSSWPYFGKRFGLTFVDTLEPKPGIPPSPSHVAALTERLKGGQVKAILMESYFDDRVPLMLQRTTGVPVVRVPVMVGAAPGVDDQFALFDTITGQLEQALRGGSRP